MLTWYLLTCVPPDTYIFLGGLLVLVLTEDKQKQLKVNMGDSGNCVLLENTDPSGGNNAAYGNL